MEYNKKAAKELIQKELGWKDYGGKHHESIFTRFFQAYYLPVKFGYDKRKAHLSSLILSGQISRDEALKEMELSPYNEETIERDKLFIAKKLGISMPYFEEILKTRKKNHTDYKHSSLLSILKNPKAAALIRKIKYGK